MPFSAGHFDHTDLRKTMTRCSFGTVNNTDWTVTENISCFESCLTFTNTACVAGTQNLEIFLSALDLPHSFCLQ